MLRLSVTFDSLPPRIINHGSIHPPRLKVNRSVDQGGHHSIRIIENNNRRGSSMGANAVSSVNERKRNSFLGG